MTALIKTKSLQFHSFHRRKFGEEAMEKHKNLCQDRSVQHLEKQLIMCVCELLVLFPDYFGPVVTM